MNQKIVPSVSFLFVVAVVAICIYFKNSYNDLKNNQRYSIIEKQFPASKYVIEQWTDFEFTVTEKVTNITKKIIFDGKRIDKINEPLKIINK